ncbi:MAG TPA: hypothetical protein VND87_04100 [Stellaceae bacterium]|nr:hypothetical protein [Stellaceae bacterium]
MARDRAADDFKTIRARLEELRRERLPEPQPTPNRDKPGLIFGHRGPCGCGLGLFADECDGSCKAF